MKALLQRVLSASVAVEATLLAQLSVVMWCY